LSKSAAAAMVIKIVVFKSAEESMAQPVFTLLNISLPGRGYSANTGQYLLRFSATVITIIKLGAIHPATHQISFAVDI
jgi:hypothetical protein